MRSSETDSSVANIAGGFLKINERGILIRFGEDGKNRNINKRGGRLFGT